MRTKTPLRGAALAVTFALVIAACGGGDGGDSGDGDGGGSGNTSAAGGTYSANLTEPEQLAPSPFCYESECGSVWQMIGERLVNVDFDTGEVAYTGLLESIETQDSQTYTLKIKPDWTFHNGEPVNADALIRGWNYTQNPENATDTAGFMSRIKGAGEGPEMSGLTKVDNLTVKVELKAPFSQFPQMLSFVPAFQPQAEECLQDTDACNEKPIGIGPYQMDGRWQHNQAINLVKYEDYQGEAPANAQRIEFKMFADAVAAYRGFDSGRIDVLRNTDPTVFPEAQGKYSDQMILEPYASIAYLGFPHWDPYYKDVNMRRAFSLSIDRQQIIDQVLNGLPEPATDIIPPILPGYEEGACEYCTHDPQRAKQLFRQAGGQQGDQVTLWFNAGAGHDQWMEAVGRQISQTLGVDFTMKSLEWSQYTNFIENSKFNGPFRLGWQNDYPSPENFLTPLVHSEGDANYGQYSNPKVDRLIEQADKQTDAQQAVEGYRKAADAVLADVPMLLVYSYKKSIIASDRVDNVRLSLADNDVAFGEVTVAE